MNRHGHDHTRPECRGQGQTTLQMAWEALRRRCHYGVDTAGVQCLVPLCMLLCTGGYKQ